MILKLGMKHQALKLYKVYINHDPAMTLTYFTARSIQIAHAFEWGKLLKYDLRGKTCRNWADGQNIYVYEKNCPQGVVCPCSGAIYMYKVIIFNISSETAWSIKAKLYT